MDWSNSWTITRKDFSIFRKKKYVLYSLIGVPVILSILLPVVTQLIISRKNLPPAGIVVFLDAFSFFYILLAALLPVALASYSIVGEKVEKSLEPLLTTPLKNQELLLGKVLAAFIPALISVYAGLTAFMIIEDALTSKYLGYFYFPNGNIALIMATVIPLIALYSIEVNIIISSRINDIRAATQLGVLPIVPFWPLYVMFELNYIEFNTNTLIILCVIVLVVDALLFPLTKALFRREEILTKWK
jgi:ABC-type transport system involved in multi-copper enzyme maturation permease subunit